MYCEGQMDSHEYKCYVQTLFQYKKMNVEEEAERLSLMKATNLINNSVSTLSDKLHWSLALCLVPER